jgi:glycosyltransferase involved in cell wall biosynthesis
MAIAACALAPALRRRPPTLVHAHFAGLPATAAALLAVLIDRPWGLSAHARDVFVDDPRLATARAARWILACSPALAGELRRRLGPSLASRVLVLRHGTDLADWQFVERAGAAPATPVVLAVGRFVPKKGFAVLIDACSRLAAAGRALRLELAGDGPQRAELERLAQTRGGGRLVSFLGWQSTPALQAAYHRAAVLAVPSVVADDLDRDNLPNVIIEALALGLPVLAADLPAMREVLAPERCGRLVPPGDVGAWVDALAEFLAGDGERAAAARRGRALVERDFDLRRTSSELARIFASFASRPHARAPRP